MPYPVQPWVSVDASGRLLIGAIADDFTGATDLAGLLARSGVRVSLRIGVPSDAPEDVGPFEVIALNVTKLRSDNVDPREYLSRLDQWRARVEAGGGSWRVINDLDRLENLLAS